MSLLRLEHVESIDSTNTELLRRPFVEGPVPAPVLLLADQQLAGRGRNGRTWVSETGRSLTASLALERDLLPGRLVGLSLVVGVSLARSLVAHGVDVRLKWPNDLIEPASAGKAGGILVETRQQAGRYRVVVGFGLNLQPSENPVYDRLGQRAAALFAPGAAPPARSFAQSLGEQLLVDLDRFFEAGLVPFAESWAQRDWLSGRPVEVLHPDGRRTQGVAAGIDAQGALRLSLPDGAGLSLMAGEVSVRLADSENAAHNRASRPGGAAS